MNQKAATCLTADFGADRIHAVRFDSFDQPESVAPPGGEFDTVFYVPESGDEILVGGDATAKLDKDPRGIVLLNTSLLKQDAPIELRGRATTLRPSDLFAAQLRRVKSYCEEQFLAGKEYEHVLMPLFHSDNGTRAGYAEAAKKAGFRTISFRDSALSAASLWSYLEEPESEHLVLCDLAASRLSLTLVRCSRFGSERVFETETRKAWHLESPVGLDEIDRVVLHRKTGRAKRNAFDKAATEGDADLLRIRLLRKEIYIEDAGPAARTLRLDGKDYEVGPDDFEAARRVATERLFRPVKSFASRLQGLPGYEEIPVLLFGGGANDPDIVHMIEDAFRGPVSWWAEAEELVAVGTALLLKAKPFTDNMSKEEMKLFNRYVRAGEENDATAQYYLGKTLAAGKGVPACYEEALDWFRLAAENGLVKAKYRMAMMLFQGLGAPEDRVQAATYLREAAEGGYPAAEFAWGKFLLGSSRNDNRQEAAPWIRQAAEQGYFPAAEFLGENPDL